MTDRPAPDGEGPAAAPVTVAPLRSLAGAGLAVAAVAVGIGALLLLTDEPDGAPTVTAPAANGTLDPADQAPPPGDAPSEQPGLDLGATSSSTGSAPPSARVAAPAGPAVTVLNNSRSTGLAAREAEMLRAAGWPIALVGNLRGRTRMSTVYYEDGQRTAAERLARAHGFPRVLPRREGLPGEGLTVVVTSGRV